MMKRYIVVIAVLVGIAAALLLAGGGVSAYPTGWTSDQQMPGSSSYCDIAVKGNFVHYVTMNSYNQVVYVRSTDGGATWSSHVRLDLGPSADYFPQVEVGPNGYVFVAFRSVDMNGGSGPWRIALRRSVDNGATWEAGYFDYTTENQAHESCSLGRSENYMVFLAYEAMSGPGSGEYNVYFRQLGDAGLLARRTVSTEADGIDDRHPSINCEGTDMFWIAYEHRHTPIDIVAKRYNASTGFDLVQDPVDNSTGDCGRPDVAVTAAGAKYITWTTGTTVQQRMYQGITWSAVVNLMASAVAPDPDTAMSTGLTLCCETNSVYHATSGADTRVMQLPSTPSMICADGYGSTTWVAAVLGDGTTYIKKTDTTAPTGMLTINGHQADGQMDYSKHLLTLNVQNALDDWSATGTDPTGDDFTNGITTVEYYTNAVGTWDLVSTKNNAPWASEIDVGLQPGSAYQVQAIIYDTAGNTATLPFDTVFVDDEAPNTTISLSPTANSAGWNNRIPKATLSTSDPSLLKTEYKVDAVGGTGNTGGTNWTEYAGPFTVPEGKWTVTYRSNDKCGNVEIAKTKSVLVDVTRPVCAVTRPDKDTIQTGYYSDDSFRLSGTGNDENGLTKAAIFVDGVEKYHSHSSFNMSCIWNIEGLPERNYTIEVRSTDPAGNVGKSTKAVFVGNIAKDWYFAEGNTLTEFDEYICVMNPGDTDARVHFSFMCEDGQVIDAEITLAPTERQTVPIKRYVPEGHTGVSTHIRTDSQNVVAERPMYFVYKQGVPDFNFKGGHDVVGVNVPQKEWYFAEGTTRFHDECCNQFDEWILLQNPSDNQTANVTITYMLGTGQNVDKGYQVGPHSRVTVEVAKDVGRNQDVSAKVASDTAIMSERAMYFKFKGWAIDGSNVVGAISPSDTWSFAEGTTRSGYYEWLCIQNPNSVAADCAITYYSANGDKTVTHEVVPPRTRATVDVRSKVGDNKDVSIDLRTSAGTPVIAERPMYYIYGMSEPGKGWNGGDSAVGNPGPSTQYFLAEGTTIKDFDTYYTMLNPEDKKCKVVVQYIFGDGSDSTAEYWIEPHSRMTIDVRTAIKRDADVSGTIYAAFPIVIERPMYFNYKGVIQGGHDVSGYGVD
jgi:hypothetical protein